MKGTYLGFTMKIYCVLLYFTLTYHRVMSKEEPILVGPHGKNDGEPEYDGSDDLEIRGGGRNGGEPDYDPEKIANFFDRDIMDGRIWTTILY